MRKILSILLIAGLLCSLCACGQQKDDHIYTNPDAGGMTGSGDINTTTPSDTENKTESTENGDELSMKAEQGSYSLKYPVSESGIKSLLTFYECDATESYKPTAFGKVYRNNAGNIVLMDNRDNFAPVNFTCEIVDGEYKIKLQYGEDKIKETTFDGEGILLLKLTNDGVNYSSSSMMYDMSQFVIVSKEDKITDMVTLNKENVDFNQTIKNENSNTIEVSDTNIKKMITFKEATPNDMYAEIYADTTIYVNETRNIIIFDTRAERTLPTATCKITTNEDGEKVFVIDFTNFEKTRQVEHPGTGVYTINLMDGGFIGMYASEENSTDIYAK